MFTFFTSIGGKIVMVLSLLAMLGAGLKVAVNEHDKSVLAMAQVSQDTAIAAAQTAATAHELQALQDQQTDLTAQANGEAELKEKTHAAPQTHACATSPAVAALLGDLRGHGRPNGSGS